MFECDKRWRETVQESRMVSVRGAHALIDDLGRLRWFSTSGSVEVSTVRYIGRKSCAFDLVMLIFEDYLRN